MSWYNSHKTGPLLQGKGMYTALHRHKKGLFSGCYSYSAKEIENGKNVSQFMSKCLGTTLLQYWPRWNDGVEKGKQSLTHFLCQHIFTLFSDPPTHYVSINTMSSKITIF